MTKSIWAFLFVFLVISACETRHTAESNDTLRLMVVDSVKERVDATLKGQQVSARKPFY